MPLKVLVTGSAGKTGQIVVRKLLEQSEQFAVKAMVRSDSSAAALKGAVKKDNLEICNLDITKASVEQMTEACKDCDAMVICTSAIPQIDYLSLFPVIFRKLFSWAGLEQTKPTFYYAEGQMPEQVDWVGQKVQIDGAKMAGLKHVVLLGSMGGTKPDHFLNTMGNGKILLWKRKAEKYLMDSGLPYTIIHAGGLLPHPGQFGSCEGGQREVLLAIDDELLDTETRLIPREDVAEVVVQSLTTPSALNVSFDLASKKEGEGEVFKTLSDLLPTLEGKSCNYDAPALP